MAGKSQSKGSVQSINLILLAHSQFTLILQAQVFATSVLNDILIPVVYAINAGTIVTTYVSLPVALAQAYNRSPL